MVAGWWRRGTGKGSRTQFPLGHSVSNVYTHTYRVGNSSAGNTGGARGRSVGPANTAAVRSRVPRSCPTTTVPRDHRNRVVWCPGETATIFFT